MPCCACKSPCVLVLVAGLTAAMGWSAFARPHAHRDDPPKAAPSTPGTVDLKLKNENIRGVLDLLAKNSGTKIVPSEKVQGTVTCTLYGVTLHQALDAILPVYGLGFVEKDGVINVYTTDELKAMGIQPRAVAPAPSIPQASAKMLAKPVSLNVKNEDIGSVLEQLSVSSGTNIVASKAVVGKVTLLLKDKPLSEVLDAILTPVRCVYVPKGNFVYVYTADEAKQVMGAAVDASVLAFKMKRLDGKEEDLSAYKGKVVMIVNVASKCGLTPQYSALEKLYEGKKDQGFVILGFPANEFNGQEPGTNAEIAEFCSGDGSKYHVTFPMFEKIVVKGEGVAPLYKKLIAQPAPIGGEPQWNFTKFIVDRDGNVVARFEPKTKPDDERVTKKIDELLAAKRG